MSWLNKLLRKPDYSAILSGFGMDRLSAQRRRVLRMVLIASVAAHLGAMLIFGSYKIYQTLVPEKTVFVTPPALKTYEPRKLEFKVKVQKQQRSSSRPSMVPRMVTTKPSNIALPEIKMDPKIVKTSFQPKFKAVSGKGLGAGLGTGYGIGGFGTGVSQFDFFGIKGRGDKIAILVDVSVSMVEDERGGPKGYDRVRNRIDQVINALAEGALFNVIVFADAASAYANELVIANDDHKTKASRFLRQFNTAGNYGLTTGSLQSSSLGLETAGGTTRLDLALTAAFEQGADTILIISDGLPVVHKPFTEQMMQYHAAIVENWRKDNRAAIDAYEAAMTNQHADSERVWIPGTTVKELKEGHKPVKGHWEIRRRGGQPRPRPPILDPVLWTSADFMQHLKMLHEALYEKRGRKLPVVHAIGYGIDKDGGNFLRTLTVTYKGRYRRVTRVD